MRQFHQIFSMNKKFRKTTYKVKQRFKTETISRGFMEADILVKSTRSATTTAVPSKDERSIPLSVILVNVNKQKKGKKPNI